MQASTKMVIDAINQAQSILIAGHISPDGDALGSMLALAQALKSMGKPRVEVICPDGLPQIYRFLPGSEEILLAPTSDSFDLGIALDCDGESRLGASAPHIFSAKKVIDIDHHGGLDLFGDITWVDSTAAATGELVFELITEMGVPINEPIAVCLLTAQMVDTGSFRYANTTSRTFAIASKLMEAGARPVQIAARLYEEKAYSAAKLHGIALSRIHRNTDGSVIWAYLLQSDFIEAGATEDETEGIINQLRSIRGGKIAVLFKETTENSVKISLRSRNGTDVSEVARQFGGGGHKLASGCTVVGSIGEVQQKVLAAVEEALEHRASSSEE
jgi:phosphoesterase RecJ-like protein